jgi:hypothetical protein
VLMVHVVEILDGIVAEQLYQLFLARFLVDLGDTAHLRL